MIDEYDIRMSLWPISVAMFSSAPWMTLVVTGSTGRFEPPSRPPAPGAIVGVSFMVNPRW